jgi:hypothetical protein
MRAVFLSKRSETSHFELLCVFPDIPRCRRRLRVPFEIHRSPERPKPMAARNLREIRVDDPVGQRRVHIRRNPPGFLTIGWVRRVNLRRRLVGGDSGIRDGIPAGVIEAGDAGALRHRAASAYGGCCASVIFLDA